MGPGYLARWWLTFPGWFWAHWEPERPVDPRILKTLVIKVFIDDAEQPQVAAPVGDLFGVGLCRVASFAVLRLGMSSGGFYLGFLMPFRRSLRIEVENTDPDYETDVFCNGLYQQVAGLDEDVPTFHAFFATGRNPGPDPIVLADVTGRGWYAGCSLSCQAERRNTLSYLEAPEHVYVDGEAEPRIVGTGLEDYFLGGWYFREGPFGGPEHGVPVKDALDSSVAMYRVHDLDAIVFDRSLRFTFQTPWAPERTSPFAFSSVSYLYLHGTHAAPPLPAMDDLTCWYRVPNLDHQSIP